MEIAIGIGIGMIIALAARSRKKRGEDKQPDNVSKEDERKHLQQADEELITVILPTINNDK